MNSLVHPGLASVSTASSTRRELEASYVTGLSTPEQARVTFRTGLVGEEIARRVKEHLELHLPGRIRHLIVGVGENSIVLRGACISYYTKQLAQHVAMEILDNVRLMNELMVLPLK